MNRRTFLETSVAAAALATLPGIPRSWAAGEMHKIDPIGVQLYTVRTFMEKDFEATITKVAGVGYKELEFAGYFNHSPKEIRTLLDKLGVSAPSCHVSYEVVEKKWKEQIEAAHVIGHKYIVCPWIEEAQRKAPGGWSKAAELFNKAGEESAKAGVQFAYHNHTFEFQPAATLGGKLPFDYFLTALDKKNVQFELDLCWITVAGKDPIEYFNNNPGRFPMVHVKDMKRLPQGAEGPTATPDKEMPNMTEVGSGVIDWKHIFANMGKGGVKYFFVEHDTPAKPMESIEKSYSYLHDLRF